MTDQPKTLWRRCYCCIPGEHKECTCTPFPAAPPVTIGNMAQDAVAQKEQLAFRTP